MTPPTKDTGTEAIVDLLMRWAGHGALIIDHMARESERAPNDAPAFDVTLRRLLRMTLKPLEDRHAATDLATATGVLLDAVETLGELLLVEPADGPEAA